MQSLSPAASLHGGGCMAHRIVCTTFGARRKLTSCARLAGHFLLHEGKDDPLPPISADERKEKTKIVDVARATGLHWYTVTLLYQETPKWIETDAIEKLCALFECQVGDLFECVSQSSKK